MSTKPTTPAAEGVSVGAVTFAPAAVPPPAQKPNPYEPVVALLVAGMNDETPYALSATVAAVDVDSSVRLAQRAGAAAGVTIRKRITETEDNDLVTLTLWAAPKIERPRA